MVRLLAMAATLICVIAAPAWAQVIGTTDDDVRQVADPILDNLLKGIAETDFGVYSRDFSEIMRSAVDEKTFLKSNTMTKALFGEYQGRSYVGFETKENLTIVQWKAKFKLKADVVIKLVLRREEDRAAIVGHWFRLAEEKPPSEQEPKDKST